MIGAQQWKAAYITNKDISAAPCDSCSLLQHLQQIIGTGEILHNRVDDHQIDAVIRNKFQFVGQSLLQSNVLKIFTSCKRLLQLLQGYSRKIQAQITFTMRSEPGKQQP